MKPSAPSAFRPSINGLRGIAVLMVILFHWSHVKGGFTGVDIFFVISGYLISGHIFKDLIRGQFSFASFYAKRTRRIIPSLTVVLLATLAMGWAWSYRDHLQLLGKHTQSGALFISNFRLYWEAGYFDGAAETKPLLHLWSLAIEEQFYLIWPLLLWFGHRFFKNTWVFVSFWTLSSFAANLYLAQHNLQMDFYFLTSRLWELSFGFLVYLSRDRLSRVYNSAWTQIAGLGLILYGCLRISGSMPFPGYHALIPVLGSGLLLGANESAWINKHLLGSRFLGFFGTISYVLYLWHWPPFALMKLLMFSDSMLWLGVLVLAASYLTHRWVEKPWMSYPVRANNRWKIIGAGVAALSVLAILGTLVANGKIPGRIRSPSLPPPEDHRTAKVCSANGNHGVIFSKSLLQPCENFRYPGRPVILLVGDSHAGCLADGIYDWAEENRVNFVAFTALYCTPLSTHDSRNACNEFNRFLESWVLQKKPDLVILDAHHYVWGINENYGESEPYYQFISSKLSEFRRQTGKQVLIVGQNPTWPISLTRVLNIRYCAKGLPVPTRVKEGVDQVTLDMDDVMKKEAARQNVPYFSIRDHICNTEGCLVRVGENLASDLMEFDNGHLSHQGSVYIGRNGLGTKIGDLLRIPSKSP